MTTPIALAPRDSRWLIRSGSTGWLLDAIEAGGGTVVDLDDAEGLVWARPFAAEALAEVLADHPRLRWVQLPFAGIERFGPVLDEGHLWTCAKGIYAEPVAEHTVALLLAAFRDLGTYLRTGRWAQLEGRNLYDSAITIVGGGGITHELIRLLSPMRCAVTVVRRTTEPVPGAGRTLPASALLEAVTGADAVVLALALTPRTEGVVDRRVLRAMGPESWLVNVARGGHVVTDDLVAALREHEIAGAALDVTDPEPLPAEHPLWGLDNCLITPHVANTQAMLMPRLAALVTENVRRFASDEPLLGLVDPEAGY